MNSEVVESFQSTSQSEESPCVDRNLKGHAQWNCNQCLERLNRSFDEVLRSSMLTYQGWTEKQIDALGSFREFDKTPWTNMLPDPSQPKTVQSRAWALSCVKELQARMDAARGFHEIMTAQHHLQNVSKAGLVSSSTGEVVCKDDNDNELHPQWTCQHCLARLDDHFDKLLREVMFDQGWTKTQIDHAGSLRRFDTKPWMEMVPDSPLPQLAQVRAWGSTRLLELEGRMTNASNVHEARIRSDEVTDETQTRDEVGE